MLVANRMALKKRYPDILKELEVGIDDNKVCGEDDISRVEFVETREGNQAVFVYKNDTLTRLNSQYYPRREAKKWAEQFEYGNISAHGIIYGLGSGIFIKELLCRMNKDNSIFVIEPDFQIFCCIIEYIDISDILLDERVQLFFFIKDKDTISEKFFSILTWATVNTIIQTIHPGYDKIYTNQITEYQEMVHRIYEKVRVTRDTMAEFADSSVTNVINSLQYIKESNYLNEFIGVFPKGYPALVVSAGPSLSKNINKIKDMENKAFIIVVDTAVKVMEENGIPYDAIAIVDPEKPAQFLTEYSGCQNKTLFCVTEAPKEIQNFHKGRKVWLPGSVWLERIYGWCGLDFVLHDIGGSVATIATEIARIVGCETIILVGQDLAYLGDKTHAGREEGMGEERGYKSRWVEGIDGKPVRTRWDWMYYLRWFEEFVEKHPEITLVDATEGGALIHGSKVMKLDEAINEYCHCVFNFQEMIKNKPTTFVNNDFSIVKKYIDALLPGMEKIMELAEKGKKCIEMFFSFSKEDASIEKNRLLYECKFINEQLVNTVGYDLIEIGSSKLLEHKLDEINKLSGDKEEDRENTANMLELFYSSVLDVGQKHLFEIKDVFKYM